MGSTVHVRAAAPAGSRRWLRVGGRLDLYVARIFALSYVAAFLLVVGMFWIFDLAANLDEYLQPDETGRTPSSLSVVRFYGLQLPFLYLQVSPFVTLVAGLFTAVRMTRANEIVAALNAGVSSRRVLLPVFFGALLLALLMFSLREWATEALGRERDRLQDRLVEQRAAPVFEDFWVQDRGGRAVRIDEYRPARSDGAVPEIRGLSARFREEGRSLWIVADRARWEGGLWRLEGGRRQEFDPRVKRSIPIRTLEELSFGPGDVELAWNGEENPLDRSFSEVLRLLALDPTDVRFQTLFHHHLSYPLAGLVLLAVGLPFVVGRERGRGAERIAAGVLLCVLYFAVEFVARTVGMAGQVGPMVAGWLSTLLFGSLGIVLLTAMRS